MIDREAEAALHNLHEYTKVKRELEVYKKALEISCEWNELNLGYLNEEECLQKAREQR